MQVKITLNPTVDVLKKRFKNRAAELPKAIKEAIYKSALEVEGAAKTFTPVDTGRLRASIFTSLYSDYAIVQPKTNYALFVHEGTRFMEARPFMRWGADAADRQIQINFEEAVNFAINKK